MTDLDRFLAFLQGCKLPHQVLSADDVLLLPTKDITYVTYATKVAFSMLDAYFAEDGRLAGLARPKPEPPQRCDDWDPVVHEPSGLTTCRNCGGSWQSYHYQGDNEDPE